MPGAYEGETVTRRGLLPAARWRPAASRPPRSACPPLGFALGPIFEHDGAREVAGRRARGATSTRDTYVSKVAHARRRRRRGRQDHDLHPQGDARGRRARATATSSRCPYVAISTRCAHLGCPVRYVQAAESFICPCHGGVYAGRRGRRRPAGAPARPLRDEGREWPRARRPALLAELEAREVQAARPVEPPRRALAVPLPVEADHMKLLPGPLAAGAATATTRPTATATRTSRRRERWRERDGPHARGRRAGQSSARSRRSSSASASRTPRSRSRSTSSAASTSAPAPARSCAASSSARSRRAPTGSTRSARPRCSPSSRRR